MSEASAGSAVAEQLAVLVPGALLSAAETAGETTIGLAADHAEEALLALRDADGLGYTVLVDLTAVDHGERDPRFEVVYHLLAPAGGERLRVKIGVAEEPGRVASACAVWPAAAWPEREVFDLYGLEFVGHPDLRRILLDEKFEGHPLRRDHPLRGAVPGPGGDA